MALMRAAMVVICVFVEGCSPFGGGAFHCATSEQCAHGTCEPEGFCSFPDATCPSGKRFGDLGGSLAGTCVGASTTDGAVVDDMPLADDSMTIDMSTSAPFCDAANEPTLVGCWELEGNAMDASGDGNHATATNVTYAVGKVGQAVVLAANSTLVVGDRASLEPPRMTIETWINPSQTPPAAGAGRWGIIDSDGAYGMFVTSSNILCSMGGALTVPFTLPVGTWTHVACTNDGTTVRMYIDGLPSAITTGGSAQGAGNTVGVVLGSNAPSGDHFIGALDQFRVFSEARTQPQICAATGLSTCK